MISKIRGRDHVNLFHKQIPKYKVRDAMLITIVATFLVTFVSLIAYYSIPNNIRTNNFSMLQVFYEAASAFGTVGLSMGITGDIGHAGQIGLIVLMFVGQLGISATLLSWTRKNPKGNLVEYPVEDVRIG
jgi:trk system potassium uptake protein TrkH